MSGSLHDSNCISELVGPNQVERPYGRGNMERLGGSAAGQTGDTSGNMVCGKNPARLTRRLRIAGFDRRRDQAEEQGLAGHRQPTALHHNLTVVSRNASDFTNPQVQVLNPWQA
jgi:hypothetical protein